MKRVPELDHSQPRTTHIVLAWTAILGLVALHQLSLLSHGSLVVFAPELLDRTFDSMLTHLLRGDAGVDRDAIGYESFTRDGRTFSYFGIVPALLRLPAMLFAADPQRMHLARLSCLLAGVAYVGILLQTVWIAHRSLPDALRNRALLLAVGVTIAFGGAPTTMANAAYVYAEPVLWAAVWVALFNLTVIRLALSKCTPTGAELVALALLAGLALNTRPTAGIDLLIGFGIAAAWYGVLRLRGSGAAPGWGALSAAALVVAAGLVVAGLVNYGRWHNALVFADFARLDIIQRYPQRLAQLAANGAFNLGRMPISLLYYLTGLPYIFKHHGATGEYLQSFYDVIEGPPSSPLLTGPLWLLLAVLGAWRALRWWPLPAAALIGHFVSALFLLSAMALTLRYRMDLAGLVALPAAFGYLVVSRWLARTGGAMRRAAVPALAVLAVVAVLGSHVVLMLATVLNPAVPVSVRCALQTLVPFVPVNMAGPLPPGCHGSE